MVRNTLRDSKLCRDDCHGRLVVITGATSGIGYAAARKYASRGAKLLCVNRNQAKSQRLQKEIQNEFGTECEFLIADLSKLSDIHRVADELARLETPIDVLIHNAGVYLTRREITSDGLEKVWVVHYLASFILNYRLMDKLRAQDRARIIMVGSEGHRFAAWGLRLDDLNWEKCRYSGLGSYGSAKLAQLLAMIYFNEQFRNSGVSINTMHPGAVKTETGQENGALYRWFKKHCFDRTLKSPLVSAEALYYLGVSKEVNGVSGKFFNLSTMEEPAPPAMDRDVAGQLWEITLAMSGLLNNPEQEI